MRTKHKLLMALSLLALIFQATDVTAVPKDVEAKSEFVLADESFNKKDFAGAVQHAVMARDLFGKTNPQIEAVLARSYVEQGNIIDASMALEKYFELATESHKDYSDLVALYAKVKGKKQKADEVRRQADRYVTNIRMVNVPAGCFQMGDNFGDGENNREQPVHDVCVDTFKMMQHEVTQGLWLAVMGNNPAKNQNSLDNPVEQVSWDDAQEFTKRLNDRLGYTLRLPTEAEWEYACRSGGKKEKYCGGDTLDPLAWNKENSGETSKVGQKAANGLWLYDMSGNVWEWVQDWYDEGYYGLSPKQNPVGSSSGAGHVVRGGSWGSPPGSARSAARSWGESGLRGGNLGFRLILPSGQQ